MTRGSAAVIAYLYREAERTTCIVVMLFLLTAAIDVGHIFHWVVKPNGVIVCVGGGRCSA